jgi:class 3 adenylate cyclase/tetratricopeptide (TPR) repeat protein
LLRADRGGLRMTEPIAFCGERRQLTIMFCDLVGSTGLSQRLDPEDLRDVIRSFEECCSAVVASYDGHVGGVSGDALVVSFGYPRSHGDEPERAVRTAIDIITAVERLAPPCGTNLQVRIGIATGLVVVSERSSGEADIVGETPNLANRLQAIAEPNTVVVSATTRQLTGRLFDFADLGCHALKGFPEPVPAWRVCSVNPNQGRFEALRCPELTKFVGRHEELAFLLKHWRSLRDDKGAVILVPGEAGIGKSRLLKEFADRVVAEGASVRRFFGSPYHRSSALHPLIDGARRFLGQSESESGLAALAAALKPLGAAASEHLPWLAALFGFPTGQATSSVTPQQRRERTLAAILWWLKAIADRRPVLLLIEDAHWLDPSSLELLSRVVEQTPVLRALVVVAFRPEFQAPWLNEPPVVLLPLDRLNRSETMLLVENVAGARKLPPALVEKLAARADGVPLFVEELTKTVLGSTLLSGVSAEPLPATLQDSLLARLDQLSSAKRAAQIAAVIGREFSYELLDEVAQLPDSALFEALSELTRAGLIFARGVPPKAQYAFKHTLVQEAAYTALLKRERRELHGRVASVLQRRIASGDQLQPEVLAHHFSEAGLAVQALQNWTLAAQRAFERSANIEVISHATRGLELLAHIPEPRECLTAELGLQLLLGGASWAAKGFASIDVERAFSRASELAASAGDHARLMDASRGLYGCYYARGDLTAAWGQAERVMALARASGKPGDLVVAHLARGQILFWRGEFAAARAEHERVLALYDPAEQRSMTLSVQIDPCVNARMHLGWSLWMLGYPKQALAAVERATADARLTGQPFSLAMALFWNGCVQLCCGRWRVTEAIANELRAVTDEHHIAFLGTCALVLQAATLIVSGEFNRGAALIREALAAFRSQQAGLGRPWALSLAVEGCVNTGRRTEGLAILDECFAALARDGERQWEAELHRLKGELLAEEPEASAQAEREFREAMTIARRQSARSLELRAALGLGRRLAERGDEVHAKALISELYDQFEEGFDTSDLRVARDFLKEGSGGHNADLRSHNRQRR